MTPARVAEVLGSLADLCEQQACALEGDRVSTVALLSAQMIELLAALDAVDAELLQQIVAGDSQCRAEAQRLAASHARGRALLPLAVERVVRRRSMLGRAGVEWYAGKPIPRPRPSGYDISA